MSWDDDLDPASVAYAIASDNGDSIHVLAGPGTGKSFALQRRVARLLQEGVQPSAILAVTFTRTAAKDLLKELHSLDIAGCERVRACTLHSLCFEMLNSENVLAGLDRPPRVLLPLEQEAIPRDLGRPEYGNLRNRIRRVKAYGAAWATLQHQYPGDPADAVDMQFEADVEGWLMFHQCMTLDELVPKTLSYLRNNPLSPLIRRYEHVLVDEYQDLNRADQETIDLLVQNGSIVVVGDDDQSIYGSLRHANPEGVIEFPQTHGDTNSRTLDECRRCPCKVVRMANRFIMRSHHRYTNRQLVQRQCNGEGEVHVLQWASIEEEATGVASLVALFIRQGRVTPGQVLVLSPRKEVGYRIRDGLQDMGYQACSYFDEEELDGAAPRERWEILTLLVNRQDRAALRYLLGVGCTDLRAAAYARLREYCELEGVSPWEGLERLESGELALPYTGDLLQRFRDIKSELARLVEVDMDSLLESWLGGVDGTARLRKLAEATLGDDRVAEIIEEWIPGPVGDNPLFLQAFHGTMHARIIQPDLPDDEATVKIMSLHKSKGLKAALVVVAGCIRGWIPYVDNRPAPAEQRTLLDEQRRLFYVAITRTTDVLVLSSAIRMDPGEARRSCAHLRNRWGALEGSPFLDHLGPDRPRSLPGQQFLQSMEDAVL